MRQLKLNKSGIIIPVMSLGTWAFGGDAIWGKTDEMQAIDTARRAVEMGIVQIDTAPAYGMGKSEEILGEALKGIRDKVILSTKCGLSWDEGNIGQLHVERDGHRIVRNLSAKSIRKDLENSLKRLKTEYIDIYYVHYPVFGTYAVPVEETMDELNRMKKEGKIRAIGASNMNPEVLNEYCTYADIEIIQEKYSLLDTHIADELLPVCQKHHVSIQAYSPLEQGLLTGKVTQDTVLSPTDVRNKNKFWAQKSRLHILNVLQKLTPYTEKYSCSLSNLIIYLTAASLPDLHVLCGARKPEQIIDNVKTLSLNLEEADLSEMSQLFEQLRNSIR